MQFQEFEIGFDKPNYSDTHKSIFIESKKNTKLSLKRGVKQYDEYQ